MKTAKQVEGDVYRLLKDSTLYTQVTGNVYRSGLRPRDSREEDIVVTFTAGLPTQIETGVVTVNIYIPFIDPYGCGVLVQDGQRCEEVESLAQAWFESLTADISNYYFELNETIHTTDDLAINQSFVVVKLGYKYYGEAYAPLNTKQEALIDATDTDGDKGYAPILTDEDGNEVSITPTVPEKEYPEQ